MLITPAYQELNVQMHVNPNYGRASARYLDIAKAAMALTDSKTVLDYGCGKGHLVDALGCAGYDPAVAAFSALPEPADLVVCFDVMEHVELECLRPVLEHIKMLARNGVLMEICLRPARKILPDGRNAHITLLARDEWLAIVREVLPRAKVISEEAGEMLRILWKPAYA